MGLVIILGAVALAIDVGHMYQGRRQLQMAVDAAAMAAALELQTCNGVANCPAMQTAAQRALTENGVTGTNLALNCAPGVVGALTLWINNGPCATGSADPNYGKQAYVEVVLNEAQPTLFARALGINTMALGARAEAMRTATGNCVYALDPAGSSSITTDVLASVHSSCGVVDESTSSSAFTCALLASFHAARISVAGGAGSLLCGINPSPHTNVPAPSPSDPLAYLAKPVAPQCGASTKSPYYGASAPLVIAGTAILNPAFAYCGGITILPTANVTFEPGIYTLQSTGPLNVGGLTISLGANVVGNGVMFYNAGPGGAITFLASSVTLGGVTLTAATSGTYSGILFYQDPANTAAATILGNTSLNTSLEGIFYFPTARVSYAVTGPERYNALVAYDIDFIALTLAGTPASSGFSSDYSGLSTGSPLGNQVALIQ